jgi:MscS family membrane protein
MTGPLQVPAVQELLTSAAILLGSYLAARAFSYVLVRSLTRVAERTTTDLDDRLVRALRRPITYAVFLAGAYAALHRLPVEERWRNGLDAVIYALTVGLVTVAAMRAYDILVVRYAMASPRFEEPGMAREFGPALSKLGNVFIVMVAAIAVLQRFNVNVQSLVVSLGVGSLAVGLAAQDTLANMFGGFTLLLDRPFRLGDRIRLSTGEVGDVETIGLRATRLKTLDDTLLIVPNSVLVKDRVVNQSRPTRSMTCRLELAVAYGADLDVAKRILMEAAAASARTDSDRPPVVLVTRFGEFAIHLLLVFWVRDYGDQGLALSEVHEEVYRGLAAAGIEIPQPGPRILPAAADRPGREA